MMQILLAAPLVLAIYSYLKPLCHMVPVCRTKPRWLIHTVCERAFLPAEAVPSTTGWVRVTLRSQIPSRWPTYSLSSWHNAREPVVALKLDTIWARQRREVSIRERKVREEEGEGRNDHKSKLKITQCWLFYEKLNSRCKVLILKYETSSTRVILHGAMWDRGSVSEN